MTYSIRFSSDTMRFGRDMSQRLSTLNVTFRKISSGLRVIRAADDTAGLSIATRLESQLKETQVEMQGTSDQLSMLQTLDSSLAAAQERLLQMREVANKAASDTHSFIDRQTLTEEFMDLMQALDEIAENSEFNGQKLLDRNEPLTLSLDTDRPPEKLLTRTSLRPEKLGRQSSVTSLRRGLFLDSFESGDVKINDVSIRGTSSADDHVSYSFSSGSAIAKAKAINHATEHTGVEAWVEENVIVAIEPMRELDLNTEHWLKVNGWAVSGFKLEEKDASGQLVQHINWGYAESGVKASVNDNGYLILYAQDGRNITVEYSDEEVRDAIRVIDVYGDPTNLANTVDTPDYVHNGDIVEVDFDTDGTYSDQSSVHGSWSLVGAVTPDATGAHVGKNDYADYYAEIIEPGGIGQATYRIKRESLSTGVIDSEPESGLFNQKGVTSSSHVNRVVEASGSFYNSASDRQFILEVVSGGDPRVGTLGDRPVVDIYEINLDDGISNKTLIHNNLEVSEGQTVDVGYGLNLEIKGAVGHYVETDNNQQTYTDSQYGLNEVNPDLLYAPAEHDYPYAPQIVGWNGSMATEFEFEVVEGGHSLGPRDPSYTDEESATIVVTAHELETGLVTSATFSNLNPQNHYTSTYSFQGLSFKIPRAMESGQIISEPSTTDFLAEYSYSYYSRLYGFSVNEVDTEYEITVNQDSVLATYSPVDVNVSVYEINTGSGLRELIQSYPETINASQITELGRDIGSDNARDGASIQFHPALFIRSVSNNGSDGSINFSIDSYTRPENEFGILHITEGGEVNGEAKFIYYYEDEPGVIIDSGDLKDVQVLADGIKYTASHLASFGEATLVQTAGPQTGFDLINTNYSGEKRATYQLTISDSNNQSASISQSAGPAANYTFNGDYDGYLDGSLELTVETNNATADPDDYVLNIEYNFTNGSTKTSTVDLNMDQNIDLGYGLTINYNSTTPIDETMTFSGTVNAKDRYANYTWHYEGESTPRPTESALITIGQAIDLGNDVSMRFNAPTGPNQVVDTGMVFDGSADPRNFDIGDEWRLNISARSLKANDTVVISYLATDLAQDALWSITGFNESNWVTGEEMVIDASHNYETDEQTLTNLIRYESNGEVLMGDVELTGNGDFKTGDLIKIKTRGYVGEVESDGYYTFGHYPTTYELTVTKGGAISDAEIAWERQDQRTDTEKNGKGTFSAGELKVDDFTYIEEGVSFKIGDILDTNDQSIAYLAQGDQILIKVGEKITYHFGSQLTLKSTDNIELDYNVDELDEADKAQGIADIDNKLGRLNFLGTEDQANEEGDKELSLVSGTQGQSLNHSLATTNLLSRSSIRTAMRTIDISLEHLNEDRANIGATMNRVEHKALALSQKSLDLLGIHMRLTGADMAKETARYAAEQLKMAMSPFLLENTKVRSLVALDLVEKRQGGRF